MRITLPNGITVEVASAEEAAELLKALEAPKKATAVEKPRSNPTPKRSAQPKVSARIAVVEANAPPRTSLHSWTEGAVHQYLANIPITTRRLLNVLTTQWAEGAVIGGEIGIQPKGLGTVVAPINQVAEEMNLPAPLEKHSRRVGRSRSTRLRLTPEFAAARGQASPA